MDDDGQHDGDRSFGNSPFARSMRAAPWMSAEPPWHMWGNSQTITVPMETTGAVRNGIAQQLIKISYKRPESWHWIFQAKLISGPDNTAPFFSRIFVHFNLTVGIGRSFQRMTFGGGPWFAGPAFEDYIFRWGDPDPFPAGATIWTTQALAPSRTFDPRGQIPVPDGTPVEQVVAQDIQLEAQVVALTVGGNVAAVGQPCVVEVSAQFAPKTHVRPDWYQPEAPHESLFGGDEVGGR